MAGGRVPLAILVCLITFALVAVLSLQATGEGLGDLWKEIAFPLMVMAGCFGFFFLSIGMSIVARIRIRRRRPMVRYQLVLSQAGEAPLEDVAGACEQLVQSIRASLTHRVTAGQPWLGIESWFLPPANPGETGTAALMLLCERHSCQSALAALRHAYPDLTLRSDPSDPHGAPLEFVRPAFVPGHVVRVRKVRSWALPIGAPSSQQGGSSVRSTMAGIIRQQQQAGRVSCVRWCLMPAPDQFDSRAAQKLSGLGGGERQDAASSGDVQQALQSAGGAMAFLELQVAVEAHEGHGRRGRTRKESFGELQSASRQLISPALSQRGANHLTERLMMVRQGLYQRRWARGEPPLIPDLTGSTLVSPRELALLLELPSLGSEHALPLQRNTVPHLPLPTEVARARIVDLELPPPVALVGATEEADAEVIHGELVMDDKAKVPR